MAALILFDDYLELAGNTEDVDVALCTPAYLLPKLSVLLGSAAVRGSDRILPGTPGVKPYQRRRTVTQYTLDLFVDGHYDDGGTPNDDPRQSFYDHLDFLVSELVESPGGDGTRTGTLHEPSGGTRSAAVTVIAIEPFEDYGVAAAMCHFVFSLPFGRFA